MEKVSGERKRQGKGEGKGGKGVSRAAEKRYLTPFSPTPFSPNIITHNVNTLRHDPSIGGLAQSERSSAIGCRSSQAVHGQDGRIVQIIESKA